MEHIRIANLEEVEAIQETSDITPRSMVVKFGDLTTVIRNIYEVDPLYTNGAKIVPLSKFIWGLEERLIGAGIDAYYFNMLADDSVKEWRELVEHWGAERVLAPPSYRYKRLLVK